MDGVLVTLEERPKDLIANVRNLGWDLERQIEERRLMPVHACADSHEYMIVSGDFDLSVLVSRVKHAVQKVQAKCVVVESAGVLFPLFADSQLIRRELQRLVMVLREMNGTPVITVEQRSTFQRRAVRRPTMSASFATACKMKAGGAP
jgi:circadian clock protein KaiC